jgi:hypothetical protein
MTMDMTRDLISMHLIEVSLDKDEEDDNASTEVITMMTEYGKVDGAYAAKLLRNALVHHLTTRSFIGEETEYTVKPNQKFDESEFCGVLIDTGAARVSTTRLPQIRTLMRNLRLDKSKAGAVRVLFCWGTTTSIETVTINTCWNHRIPRYL